MSNIKKKITVIFFTLICLNNQIVNAQEGISKKIDIFLNDTYKSETPGAVILVVKDNTVILRKAYGMGNIEHNIPLNPDMTFRIGSITKQFTAAAIMKLVEQKKVSLSDPIEKFLPDYPTHGHIITIENLLTHTSGIANMTSIPNIMQEIGRKDLSAKETIDAFKKEPMDFDPSTKYNYSNSGYIILGAIIENVSGKTYQDYIQDEFFTPLNMTDSFYGSFTKIIPNRSAGYHRTENGYENAQFMSMYIPFSAGSLLSTVDDLQKWNNALFSGKVVSNVSLKKMTTPFTLSNNLTTEYGYGLGVAEKNGKKLIGHAGGIGGFQTYLGTIPDIKLSVIVLTNTDNPIIQPSVIADKIFEIAIQ